MGFKFEISIEEKGPTGLPTGKMLTKGSENAYDIFLFYEQHRGKKKKHTQEQQDSINQANAEHGIVKNKFRKKVKK